MMASISALAFDLDGHVVLALVPRSSDTKSLARRVNRVATLDGGAVVNDFGLSDADRVLTLAWRSDGQTEARIRQMMRSHGVVRVTTDDGVFLCAWGGYSERGAEGRVEMLVIERVSA